MPFQADPTFWQELRRYLEEEPVDRVIIHLHSGDEFSVDNLMTMSLGDTWIGIYERNGKVTVFPVTSVCAAQIFVSEK